MKTQLQHFADADARICAANNHFMEMVNHPTNPLTNEDLERLVARFPERWGRFSNWIGGLAQ